MVARKRNVSLEETFEISKKHADVARKSLLSELKSKRKALDRQIRGLSGKKKSKKSKKVK